MTCCVCPTSFGSLAPSVPRPPRRYPLPVPYGVLTDIYANNGGYGIKLLRNGVLLVFGALSQPLTPVGSRSTAGPFR